MRLVLTLSAGFMLASCAWAQHASGGHSGGFSHAGGGFTSGRSFSAQASGTPHSFSSSSPYRPNTLARPSGQFSSITGPPPVGAAYGNRAGYRPPYGYGGYRPYSYSRSVYLVPGWLNYGVYGGPVYGYSDQSGESQPTGTAYTGNAAPDDAVAEMDVPPAYTSQPRPAYEPEGQSDAGLDQPPVTLVFKDGRPSQQVQNYALTPTTLYVLDGARRREIPLGDLNLPLTEKTNREAGVDFVVPVVAD